MDYYSKNAAALFEQYNGVDSSALHKAWIKNLPDQPGLACDLGAGSGRDAYWLANKGWHVVAVEPADGFRELAREESHDNVTWLNDSLPSLSKVRQLGQRFSLILLSAVWMHIPEAQRERAFRLLSNLLLPGGLLVISLRQGTKTEENTLRSFYPVSVDELESLARQRALAVVSVSHDKDIQARTHVSWQTVVMTLPDDGTGSLPLLRHIIVNDDKSSTYKLALLRTLIRIADGAPGMVLKRADDWVEIPFGLVGLYWLKLYKPLVITENLIQAPGHNIKEQSGLGFAKAEHFYRLKGLSAFDMRVGAILGPEWAAVVIGSIRDACSTIQKMPANFITYPGQSTQVFQCEKKSFRFKKESHWRIDKESLSRFGTFRIPLSLWQSFSQFACWIEPAILNEWSQLMDGYNLHYDKSIYDKAFQWESSKRSTVQVRNLADKSAALNCVWTGVNLQRGNYEIDHCFPWSRWFNNDLWNLMPASVKANGQKSEKLPSATLMHSSRDRIQDWWQSAYAEESLHKQFLMEASAALPMVASENATLNEVFDAVLFQRTRLRMEQRLAEWQPRSIIT